MADAPERIWAQQTAGDNWDEPIASPYRVDHFHEYIRADLAKPTVKPLEWVVEGAELHTTGLGLSYIIVPTSLDASASWIGYGQDNGVLITGARETLDAAKAAAQAHYTAQIMKALGVSDEE